MWPVVTSINLASGNAALTSYSLMTLLAVGVAVLLAPARARRMGLPSSEGLQFVALAVAGGVIGARLTFVAFNLRTALASSWTAVVNQGGAVWYGGVAGGAAATIAYARYFEIPLASLFDLSAPILACTHAIGRVGCFLVGCCYGSPTTMPWGVRFPASGYFTGPTGVALHPVQLYEAAFELTLAGFLFAWGSRPRGGRLLAVYLLAYAPFRLLMEMFFRGDDRGTLGVGVSPSGVISLVVVAGLGLLFFRTRTQPSEVVR